MKLYLIRHGAYTSEYTSNAGPGLSPLGVEQARAAGRFLRRQHARPDLVITSDLLRARETARVIQEMLRTDLEPVESRDFSPSGDPETMAAILSELPGEEILVVGHMCSIGELARHLSLQAPFIFETCTVVALERRPAGWHLLWFNDCGKDVN